MSTTELIPDSLNPPGRAPFQQYLAFGVALCCAVASMGYMAISLQRSFKMVREAVDSQVLANEASGFPNRDSPF